MTQRLLLRNKFLKVMPVAFGLKCWNASLQSRQYQQSQTQQQFPGLLIRLFVVCETVWPHYRSVLSVLSNSDHIKLKNVWLSSWISFSKHMNQDAPASGCGDKWCSCCPQKQKSQFWRGQIDFLTRLDGILLPFLFQFSPKADNEQQRGEKLLLTELI